MAAGSLLITASGAKRSRARGALKGGLGADRVLLMVGDHSEHAAVRYRKTGCRGALPWGYERVQPQPQPDDAPHAGPLTLHGCSIPRPCDEGLDFVARSEPLPLPERFR